MKTLNPFWNQEPMRALEEKHGNYLRMKSTCDGVIIELVPLTGRNLAGEHVCHEGYGLRIYVDEGDVCVWDWKWAYENRAKVIVDYPVTEDERGTGSGFYALFDAPFNKSRRKYMWSNDEMFQAFTKATELVLNGTIYSLAYKLEKKAFVEACERKLKKTRQEATA